MKDFHTINYEQQYLENFYARNEVAESIDYVAADERRQTIALAAFVVIAFITLVSEIVK